MAELIPGLRIELGCDTSELEGGFLATDEFVSEVWDLLFLSIHFRSWARLLMDDQ